MLARATLCVVVALAAVAGVAAAAPFEVPALDSRVIDPGHRLSATDQAEVDAMLAGFRQRTGVPIVVFVPASLAGNTIEDVAYQTFNTWKLGDKGKDNGVLVVIAPVERRVRIEVGNGLGGALTDLQANDIIRTKMAPLLAGNQLREAIDAGFIGIAAAIEKDPSVVAPRPGAPSDGAAQTGDSWSNYLILGVIGLILLSSLFRRGGGGRGGRGRGLGGGGWFGGFGGGGFGGGGFGGGGFGGGGGGSDFGGGGGHSGGGGSSDSF